MNPLWQLIVVVQYWRYAWLCRHINPLAPCFSHYFFQRQRWQDQLWKTP